jgi:transcriptional regulator of acetoin/glycerol metabolism
MRSDATSTTDTDRGESAALERKPLVLVWVAGPAAMEPLRLDWEDAEPRILGRDDEECAVRLSGTDVSRQHASLQRETSGDDVAILELGSRNGTRINGHTKRVAKLARGDVIRLGSWVGVVTTTVAPFGEIAPGVLGGGVLRGAIAELEQAAHSDLPIVLEGETGTGKEVLARAVHGWSRRQGPFLAVNCAALPEGLAESELFGHRRGAFTGADRASPGLFRSADQGTLLLDEIFDLPLAVQAKLLRVLEQREVQPLGEARPVPINVRVIAAGQQSLLDAVKERRFRADLLARLDGLTVRLPPLRERREDVPLLFQRLWRETGGGPEPRLECDFVERMCVHDWPLNVRELVLLARRLQVFHAKESALRAHHLPERIAEIAGEMQPAQSAAKPPGSANLAGAPERVELPDLLSALRACRGNVARASALLGITRQRAYRLIEESDVDLEALRR